MDTIHTESQSDWILSTLVYFHIAGIDCTGHPKAAQHLIGVVPDESNLYPELTGFDNLVFYAALYGIRKKERESRARENFMGLKYFS